MKPFEVIDCEQRSPEWFASRAGRVTSSVAADMLATLKSKGEAAGRRNLRVKLALERVIGRPIENNYQSAAMAQGVEREALARAAYEAETGMLVRTAGFLVHRDLMAGGSPDGVIGNYDGLLEIKCCQPPAHLEFLRATDVPDAYFKQATHLLWLTGAPWIDVAYWSPDFPPSLQLKVMRLPRDEKQIQSYELALTIFLNEIHDEESAIRALMETAHVAV